MAWTGSITVEDSTDSAHQGVIELLQGGPSNDGILANGGYFWKSRTKNAFAIPDQLFGETLECELVSTGGLWSDMWSSRPLILYYRFEGKRYNVVRIYDWEATVHLSDNWNDSGDSNVFTTGAKMVEKGLGTWTKLSSSS